jgi:hypothetical protein
MARRPRPPRWLQRVRRLTDPGPSTTLTVEYTENNPGDWLYHCHVTDHMAGGMVGRYLTTSRDPPGALPTIGYILSVYLGRHGHSHGR